MTISCNRSKNNKFIKVPFLFLLAFSLIYLSISTIYGLSSQQIGELIQQEEQKLKNLKESINQKYQELSNLRQAITTTQNDIPSIQNQINHIQKEIELNQLIKREIENLLGIKKLEKKIQEYKLIENIKLDYLNWKSSRFDVFHVLLNDGLDVKLTDFYRIKLFQEQTKLLYDLNLQLDKIQKDITDIQNKIDTFVAREKELFAKKKELEAYLNSLTSMLGQTTNIINTLEQQRRNIQQNLSFLSIEQKIAQERERILLLQNNNIQSAGNGVYLDTFEENKGFVVFGRGRDLYQGHGVGLSQLGAHGMAQNGWSYKQILQFYYQNTEVRSGYENFTINVEGYGPMNIEDYVAGQGEILPPRARACGTPEQVAHNPRKYATSGCWPEEAIKALVVAYRTYALFYTKNGRSICTNVNCQVYNPNYDSRWAVDETRGEVITYNGNLIEAVYSAENNQGFGTANNETVFQSFSGDGNPFPYLRSVNDNDVSTKGPYHNWTYKTKAYSLEDIRNLLMFVANNPSKFGSISTYISSFDLSNTNYRYMSLERDPSLRVSKVKLFTTDGRIHVIGGYWFKYIWNIYVYENNIRNESGRYDYIYSQTYFIHKL